MQFILCTNQKSDNSDPIIDAYKALMGKDAEQVDYDKASPMQIQKDFPPTMLIHGSMIGCGLVNSPIYTRDWSI